MASQGRDVGPAPKGERARPSRKAAASGPQGAPSGTSERWTGHEESRKRGGVIKTNEIRLIPGSPQRAPTSPRRASWECQWARKGPHKEPPRRLAAKDQWLGALVGQWALFCLPRASSRPKDCRRRLGWRIYKFANLSISNCDLIPPGRLAACCCRPALHEATGQRRQVRRVVA